MPRAEIKEVQESFNNQPEYQLGIALQQAIIGHENELNNNEDTSVTIPQFGYPHLRRFASMLRSLLKPQEDTKLPMLPQHATEEISQKLRGFGWNKSIELQKMKQSIDIAGNEHYQQLLKSVLETPEGTYKVAITFKDREGYPGMLVPDAIQLQIRKRTIVDAESSLPVQGRRRTPRSELLLDLEAVLEDYPLLGKESVQRQQTIVTIKKPSIHAEEWGIISGPHGFVFDAQGHIIRQQKPTI